MTIQMTIWKLIKYYQEDYQDDEQEDYDEKDVDLFDDSFKDSACVIFLRVPYMHFYSRYSSWSCLLFIFLW